jgi:hypothetical protein
LTSCGSPTPEGSNSEAKALPLVPLLTFVGAEIPIALRALTIAAASLVAKIVSHSNDELKIDLSGQTDLEKFLVIYNSLLKQALKNEALPASWEQDLGIENTVDAYINDKMENDSNDTRPEKVWLLIAIAEKTYFIPHPQRDSIFETEGRCLVVKTAFENRTMGPHAITLNQVGLLRYECKPYYLR